MMHPRGFNFAVFACLLFAGGCITNSFEVINAATGQPIEGVTVTRQQWNEKMVRREFEMFPSLTWHWLDHEPLGPTDAAGKLTSHAPRRSHTIDNGYDFEDIWFHFEKAGYGRASAMVKGDKATVESSAPEGATPSTGSSTGPATTEITREVTVSAHSTIRIPIWPVAPATSPSSAAIGDEAK